MVGLDIFSTSTPATTVEETCDDLEGVAVLAGLIKVTLFLAVPAAITLAVRGRLSRRAET